MVFVNIDRCKVSATQACRSKGAIDDFINYLTVITGYQENELLINDYEKKPPLEQKLIFIQQQLSPYEKLENLFYLAKNSYELNDNYSGLPLNFINDAV